MQQPDQDNHHHQNSDQLILHADSSPDAWPTEPNPIPPSVSVQGSFQGPRPEPLRRYRPNRDWQQERDQERAEQERLRRQEHNEQQRREYLWRKQFELRLERQRLDTEEQALQQQWDALPHASSRLVRLIIATTILVISIGGIVWDPAVLILLILVVLIIGSVRRQRRPSFRSSGDHWAVRERFRIQSRIAWIDARVVSLQQEEQAIAAELMVLTPPPDMEP
jgi:hypothetical protein